MILGHDWYHSNVLLLYIHGESGPSKTSPNATLELLFAKKLRAELFKDASWLAHQASMNKKKLSRIQPTMLNLAQCNNQPTIERHESKQ
jgi:hypothetical protein